jgi:hypothetical protein
MEFPVRLMLRPLTLCLLLACPLLVYSSTPPKPMQGAAPVVDSAYVASQFGASFKLDPKIPPMFGDLDGDGYEDLVLVGTSGTPLLSQEQFKFKVEDPYDQYYGTGDPKITSQFTLHFDGSSRCILIVFGWRLPPPAKPAPKQLISKFVLINTPFDSLGIVNLRFKKKDMQAVETIDRTSLHSLVFWDGKRWRWSAQGMAGDDTLFKMPPQN